MAKRRKRSKRRKKKSSKGLIERLNLDDGVGNQILAVAFIVLALVLMAGWFTTEAGTNLINNVTRWLVGGTIYLAPALLLYLATMIFKADDHKLPLNVSLGSIGLVWVVSGLFHISYVENSSFEAAKDGLGGGVAGHAISYPLNTLFGTVTVVILIGLLLVMTSVMFNLRLSDMFGWVAKLKPNKKKPKKDKQTTATTLESKSRPTLNANVPMTSAKKSRQRSSFKDTAKKISNEEQHQDALTMSADPDWNFPTIDLLNNKVEKADVGDWEAKAELIKDTLAEFNINVQMGDVNLGPRLTQYTLLPESGVKLSKITQLEQNIKLSTASSSIRIEAPIPGKRAVGIEVPNKKSALVRLRSIIESREWSDTKSSLSFALGQDISGQPVVADLDNMPHVLIAGQTGSGKSVMINTLLCSLLYRNAPSDLKLILVDPKQVELSLYEDIPHLLTPVITDAEKTISALKWTVEEMERRLKQMKEAGARNIDSYNSKMSDSEEAMPYIVIVIDELADMMMQAARDVEALVVRLAAKARATGIHLVLATQRPSADVITGLIKANIPARIAFTVTQNVESRIILDQSGAEKLLGAGDMLYIDSSHPRPRRIQGVFIDDKEVNDIVDHLKGEAEPDYNDDVISQPVSIGSAGGVLDNLDESDEDIYQEAVDEVVQSQKASISRLQRKFSIGYNRAARLVETMEEQGIVGPSRGNRARKVLVQSLDEPDELAGDDESFEG